MTTMLENVARALFKRKVAEDVCDGTWEENEALHESFLEDAEAAVEALRFLTKPVASAIESKLSDIGVMVEDDDADALHSAFIDAIIWEAA